MFRVLAGRGPRKPIQPIDIQRKSMSEQKISATIDASGLTCPLPLLKAKQGLKNLGSGECLRVIATDPGSERDFQVFAELSGNELLLSERDGDSYIYVLRKA